MWAARRAVVAVRGAARTVGITRFQHSQAAPKAVYQNKLRVIAPDNYPAIPIYRVLGLDNMLAEQPDVDPIPNDTLVEWYKHMVLIKQMDDILYEAQRQGRISFYMTSTGEEAIHIGTAAALSTEDVVFAQYREVGVLLYRGFTLQQVMDQCYGNKFGHGLGRQMPVHYGSAKLNFHTISSPLGTQLPHATGCGFTLRETGNASVVYFGDGAASEGDAHAAMNFAATLKTPTLFLCRNNGFAISTPVEEQYRGDGIASRAAGYGMHTIRVDGNDIFAVYNATRKAREIATEPGNNKPVLVEYMTFRVGHHSTSDDASAYREQMDHSRGDPALRLRHYLEAHDLWTEAQDQQLAESIREKVLEEFEAAEHRPKPGPETLFTDVLDEMPPNLKEQWQEVQEHLRKYGSEYKIKLDTA